MSFVCFVVSPSEPFARDRFGFSGVVFVRLLALVHVVAFVSAWPQLPGLIGPHGVAPADAYLAAAHAQLGRAAHWEVPTLCWLWGTHAFLSVLCAGGIVLGCLLFIGVAPALCLLLLWVAYLSLVGVGQMFWGFQWDGLLLETTLAAIFVVPWRWLPWWRAVEPPWAGRLVLWWLAFRLFFLAGVVKLASGDPTWRNLTALTFHYETQPLPTPLAWYAQQAPLWWHKLECVGMFVIELGAPFLLFLPRRWRHGGALVLAALMVAIAATGNYTFFNALAIALCLFCVDDAAWAWVLRLPRRAEIPAERPADSADGEPTSSYGVPAARGWKWPCGLRARVAVVFSVFAFGYTAVEVIGTLSPALGAPPGFNALARVVEPLRSFNRYGLFAVMTHPRPELIIEGSDDARTWQAYEFPYKPGALATRPKFVAPLQPRLDWQMWFAALGSAEDNPWIVTLCEHLLLGTSEVLELLQTNPFPAHPPRYVRIVRYEYHFTDPDVRRRTGDWWRRTPMDIYLGPATLRQ